MTFGKPSTETTATGAFAYKGILPSYAMNYIDNEFPNILDKTGDVITGLITIEPGGQLAFEAGSFLNIQCPVSIQNSVAVTINNNVAVTLSGRSYLFMDGYSSIQMEGTSSIFFENGATINGTATIIGNINCNVTNAITVPVEGGITSNTYGGFLTGAAGGFVLGGGANDWPTFGAGRTRTYRSILRPLLGYISSPYWAPEFTNYPYSLQALTATSNGQFLEIPYLHNGATLISVTVVFSVQNVHSSGAPAGLPFLQVKRVAANQNGVPVIYGSLFDLSTTQSQFFSPTPVSGSAWYNGEGQQYLTYYCNQYNVIDTVNWMYFVLLSSENGTNAESGNIYTSMILNYGNINNMQFP